MSAWRHRFVLLVAGLYLATPAAHAQGEDRFVPARDARETAEAADAALLAPDRYQSAVKAYERARQLAAQGSDADAIDRPLSDAERLFRSAAEVARNARPHFETALAARDDAREAEAWRAVPERWQDAEKALATAARRFEKGDTTGAREGSLAANDAFREAELQALRARHLSPVRRLMVEAEAARAEKRAPQSWAVANRRLAEAESALAANRSDPDKAAPAIETARREAAHALRVAQLATRIDEGELSTEQAVLRYERLLSDVAAAADLPGTSLGEDGAATAKLVSGVRALRERAVRAERELAGRDRQIAALEDEMREMDERLGGASAERDRLRMKLGAQDRAREQLAMLETLFGPKEGRIAREGGNLILRVTGLSFRSGSAELASGAEPLLAKVEQVIALYPRSGITIEGHSDSQGPAAANRKLSEARARTVEQRLTTSLALPAGRLRVAGYGERRPVASNSTESGRARNRRIDIVIEPPPGAPAF